VVMVCGLESLGGWAEGGEREIESENLNIRSS
jgi:hypothetical protein